MLKMLVNTLILALLPLMFSCGDNDFEKYIPPFKGGEEPSIGKVVFHERAKSLFECINQYYKITEGPYAGLYRENYPAQSGDPVSSFLWPYDGLISGASNLYELGYGFDYGSMVDRFEAYYRDSGEKKVGGYGSSTNGTAGMGDRFYDDNSIVGLDLLSAYKLLKKEVYLNRAKKIVDFLKSGEDDVFGGGLWWNESLINIKGNVDSNKPACSNGFAALFLLRYSQVCPASEKKEVLDFAKRLYAWIYSNLRDPEDACYWNDKNSDGNINKTKWTYNTGVMISNGVLLYKITGDKKYLDEAVATAQSSYNYFVRPKGALALSYPDHDPWFNVKLVNAYIEILPYYKAAETYIDTFIANLVYAYDNARFVSGLYYEDWTGVSAKRGSHLLMQAAALESLGVIALYKKELENK